MSQKKSSRHPEGEKPAVTEKAEVSVQTPEAAEDAREAQKSADEVKTETAVTAPAKEKKKLFGGKKKQAPVKEEASDEEGSESLMDHIAELRRTLIHSLAAVGIAFLVIYTFFIDALMNFITEPISARGIEYIYTSMSEAFTTKFKVAIIAGVVLAFPVIVYEIWKFIKPALYPEEQKSFRKLFFASLVLFLTGVVFCYGAVYFLAVDFFMVSGEGLATPMLSIDKYVSFLFGFLVPFGIAFMLPVFLYITTRIGLTTPEMLASKRKYIILAIAIVAAILTPPDVVSQLMLGVPMYALYEVSILVARLTKKRERS